MQPDDREAKDVDHVPPPFWAAEMCDLYPDDEEPKPEPVNESAPVLVTRLVTVHRADGTTFQRHQKVSAGEDSSPSSEAEEPPHPDHALGGLRERIAAIDPKLVARSGLMHRLGEAAITAAARVNLFLLKHHAAIDSIAKLAGAILDTPDDLRTKFGYNPTVSAGTGPTNNDPMRTLTAELGGGISTHLACTVVAHALSAGIKWAQRKSGGKAVEGLEDARGLFAELCVDVMGSVNEAMGLEGVPSVENVLAGLRRL